MNEDNTQRNTQYIFRQLKIWIQIGSEHWYRNQNSINFIYLILFSFFLKSQRETQCLSNTHHDIVNEVTSHTQNRLHSGISTTKIMAIDQSKLEIISSKHESHESNPHNRSKTCTIRTLNLFPKSNSPRIFKFNPSQYSHCHLAFPPHLNLTLSSMLEKIRYRKMEKRATQPDSMRKLSPLKLNNQPPNAPSQPSLTSRAKTK